VKDDAAFLAERIAASDGGKTRSVLEREPDAVGAAAGVSKEDQPTDA
jgi:hypothetical protein